MKLLLVAATEAEIAPVLEYLQRNWPVRQDNIYSKDDKQVTICISGIGMAATTYYLTKQLNKQYDFALQAGIAGSFDRDLKLGQIVFVNSEQYGDLGAEDHYKFLDVFDLDLLKPGSPPFSGKELVPIISAFHEKIDLQKVKGLTINTVAGSEFTIQARIDKFAAQVESMEGAAFHFVCLKENIPFAQVRSISNYVEPRDKSKWKMKEAIIALNKWLIDFIEQM